ncbi:tRNA (5-methylaminomethyl-2-thiouridine)(34)-methyltransferase MnmD [Thermovibrio ammonificans]
MRVVTTQDGSKTFLSDLFNEHFHSTTAGAFTEAVEKFCKPCKVAEVAASRGEVTLLDSCFGLGYNTVAFLDTVLSANPSAAVRVVAYEFDLRVPLKALELNWGRYEKWKPIFRGLLGRKVCNRPVPTFVYTDGRVSLKLLIADGRRAVKSIEEEHFADAIFHDPFSPKVNPELWTYEFFRELRRLIKPEGILATYSAATPVRRALHMAGFGVREGVAVGRKSRSTVASPSFETEGKLLEKFRLPSAVPFRDPTLSEPRELIKSRREGCVKLLEKSLPLEQIW